jgi:hypothetical protein
MSGLLGVFFLESIKQRFRFKWGTTGLTRCDIVFQRLALEGLVAFCVFEQAQSGTDNLTDVVVASAGDLIADEGLKMWAEGNAGGHVDLLTVINYYFLAHRPCQD